MKEREIIIKHPRENTEHFRDFSYTHPRLSQKRFEELCMKRGITPVTHPKVCDLFAGQGAMSFILKKHGWRFEDITCIDKHCPNLDERLVGKVQWVFWDLKELTKALIEKVNLANDVLAYKGRFDLVVMAYNGILPSKWEPFLVEFFAKNKEDILVVPSDWDWAHLGN